jgi:hypothetical protein
MQAAAQQTESNRYEATIAETMPNGYAFTADANSIAEFMLGKSAWAVLALACHFELCAQRHYRGSIDQDADLSTLSKDVLPLGLKEEPQHAILDEPERLRQLAGSTRAERDRAATDFIDLVGAIDGVLQAQAAADANYFFKIAGREFTDGERDQVRRRVLKAYRWQYIVSGVQEPRFAKLLGTLTDEAQGARIAAALAPILSA